MDSEYRNCWVVASSRQGRFEYHRAQEQATALMILDFMVREIMEQGPVPGSVSLLWYNDMGEELVYSRTVVEHLSHRRPSPM